MYKITKRQKENAERLNVMIKPSSNPKKKIDVYNKKGEKLAEIGDANYNDFDIYIKTKGLSYAKERQRLYKIRHQSDRNRKGTAGYYADKILW
jgi:hypothetical protein